MRVDERRRRIRRNPERLVCDVGGLLRIVATTRFANFPLGSLDGRGKHGRLPTARCPFHDHQRISRCECCCRFRLPDVEAGGLRQLAHVRHCRLDLGYAGGEEVAQFGFGLHDARASSDAPHAPAQACPVGGSQAILQRQPRRRRDELSYLGRRCLHAVLGHDPAPRAQSPCAPSTRNWKRRNDPARGMQPPAHSTRPIAPMRAALAVAMLQGRIRPRAAPAARPVSSAREVGFFCRPLGRPMLRLAAGWRRPAPCFRRGARDPIRFRGVRGSRLLACRAST